MLNRNSARRENDVVGRWNLLVFRFRDASESVRMRGRWQQARRPIRRSCSSD